MLWIILAVGVVLTVAFFRLTDLEKEVDYDLLRAKTYGRSEEESRCHRRKDIRCAKNAVGYFAMGCYGLTVIFAVINLL